MWACDACILLMFFFYYMRLLLRLQLILHENITDMYKLDYNWDQHTSKLMERCPYFNSLKYSRNVYSSHWGKKADCLHPILFKETPPHALWRFELLLSKLESSSSHHSAWLAFYWCWWFVECFIFWLFKYHPPFL